MKTKIMPFYCKRKRREKNATECTVPLPVSRKLHPYYYATLLLFQQ